MSSSASRTASSGTLRCPGASSNCSGTLSRRRSEVFAYVLNLAKNGDHYWVLAHVTPTFGADGQPIGYHSSRRKPENGTVDKIVPLYERLLAEEQRQPTKWQEIDASTTLLTAALAEAGVAYDEFVFSLASPASG